MTEMTTRAVISTGDVLAAIRVRQWTKNLLVLAPLLPAADVVGRDALLGAVAAFVVFCMISSGVYLLNDVLDLQADRMHPVKRHRPIAAGTLPVPAALGMAAVLVTSGCALAGLRNNDLLAVALVYVAIQFAYCVRLKHEPVLELASVASGFLLRALAGGVGAEIYLSSWFLLAAGFGSLFVAAGKRYAEARQGQECGAPVRTVVQSYSLSYLRFVWTAAAALVIATYASWAFQVQAQTQSVWSLVSTVPFVLALLRYAVNVDAGLGQEPEELVLRDRMLLALGAIWGATLVLAVFL